MNESLLLVISKIELNLTITLALMTAVQTIIILTMFAVIMGK